MGIKWQKFAGAVRSMFVFTKSERKGILLLVPLMLIVSVAVLFINRPGFEQSFTLYADEIAAGSGDDLHSNFDRSKENIPTDVHLFEFDPNTISYDDLRGLGFSKGHAAGIVKYRLKGKVFNIAEDFASCYGVSDSVFLRLRPYIKISTEFKIKSGKRQRYPTLSTTDIREEQLVDFDPNKLTVDEFCRLGFSSRQAEAIVKRREQIGGFGNAKEFSECYVVSGDMYEKLEPYIKIITLVELQKSASRRQSSVKVDINSADSTSLVAVGGIGAKTAERIIAWRKSLGGFASVEQLQQVEGMTLRNYEAILPQIFVDNSKIKKIDINFALPEQLAKHPYLQGVTLRKLVKNRQLKGGWSTLHDMIEDKTLTSQQAEMLAPYLIFNVE